jgi:hypothetical protein
MAYTAPTNEPKQLRAGDTWNWRREDLGDYPATSWTLKYYFRNAAAKFDVTAAADGDLYEATVAKATTAAYAAGWYDWVAVVEDATDRHQVDSGRVEILPNLATDVVYDARSFARKMLDYVEAALLSRASSDQLDLINAQLEARSITRDKAGLLTLRAAFAAEVRREDLDRSGVKRHRILAVG